jgi:hypothetical protein
VSDAEANERRRHEVAGAESGARNEQSGTVSDGAAGDARRHEVAAHRGAEPERTIGTVSDAEANARHRALRTLVTLLAVLLMVAALPAVASAGTAAGGAAITAAPACMSPLGKYGGTLTFQLTGVQPVVVTSTGSNILTITGRYTNTSTSSITKLGYKFQRGEAFDSADAITEEAAHPCQQTTIIDSGFADLPGTLKAGATGTFSASVPITGKKDSSLAITKPGVYPVMININASLHLPDDTIRARVGELHLMVTVLSVPGSDGATIPGESTPAPSIALNMLWPLIDRRHLGLNGVFLDDDLAAEVAPGGRLRTLLDTLTNSAVSPSAVTLVVDPMLLDELDRMASGYWVQKPDTAQAPLTPTPRGTATITATDSATARTGTPTPSTNTAHSTSTSHLSTTASTSAATTTIASTTAGTSTGPSTDTSIGTSAGSREPADPAAGQSAEPANLDSNKGSASDTANASPGTTTDGTGGTTTGGTTTSGAPSTEPSPTAPSPTAPSTSAPSTTRATPPPAGTVAGTGSADAAAFLDQLRQLALSFHVLVLPYGDPDMVALVRAGMTDDLATAVYRGRAIAARVLQQPIGTDTSTLVTTVALPPDGMLDTATMQTLLSFGYTSAVLQRAGLTDSESTPLGVVPVALSQQTVPVLLPDAPLTRDLGDVMSTGVPEDWPDRLNLLAALLTQDHTDGPRAPMILSPDRDWSPNQVGFTTITTLLSTLSDQGVVAGTPLAAIANTVADQQAQATLNYPSSAQQQELSPAYLQSIKDIEKRITVLSESLTADPSPDGADPDAILDPLQDALLGSASVTLRGDTDPDPPVLRTITATLDSLYGGVTVRRTAGSYTLASSSAPLLLTVQNTLPYQVTVNVSIVGGGPAGLVTHDPGPITIAAGPRTKPVKISSEVSRSGTFTVYAQLRGTDGALWGPRVPVRITSHAYGVLTLVLMLVAGGVLVLMVAFRIHQRWRARQRRLATERAGGESAGVTVGASGTGLTATGGDGGAGDEGPRDARHGGTGGGGAGDEGPRDAHHGGAGDGAPGNASPDDRGGDA